MARLNDAQRQRAIDAMRSYLANDMLENGVPLLRSDEELDQKRVALITGELQPLLRDYLTAGLPLSEFKSQVDGLNKRNELWGFKGIKGQMFFNLTVNTAQDQAELERELKQAIVIPTTADESASRIVRFEEYIDKIGQVHVQSGGSKQGRAKIGSIPFFLSYFWQIQDRVRWPVFYTTAVKAMSGLAIWQPTGNLAVDYVEFKQLHEELKHIFTEASGRDFDLYGVEHVFWYMGENPAAAKSPQDQVKPDSMMIGKHAAQRKVQNSQSDTGSNPSFYDDYVPPIVAVLPRVARNEPELESSTKLAGLSLPRAFEKCIHAAFTILGYDATLLGQGSGRVPDGVAIDHDSSYALLWDAKVRADGYRMGTDDRAIREYVMGQSRDLKRRRTLRNIYYLVISGEFHDDFDDLVRCLKMETDVNEVCFVTADAIVAMVDARLRNPSLVTPGPDGLQRLFCGGGVVSAEDVRRLLGESVR